MILGGTTSSNKLIIQNGQGGVIGNVGPSVFKCISNGLEMEEVDGLDIEDRKRRRSGSEIKGIMDVENVLSSNEYIDEVVLHLDAAISGKDFSATTNPVLATLAMQASRTL